MRDSSPDISNSKRILDWIKKGKRIYSYKGMCASIDEEIKIEVYHIHEITDPDMCSIFTIFELTSDGFWFITSFFQDTFKEAVEDEKFMNILLGNYTNLMYSDRQDDRIH